MNCFLGSWILVIYTLNTSIYPVNFGVSQTIHHAAVASAVLYLPAQAVAVSAFFHLVFKFNHVFYLCFDCINIHFLTRECAFWGEITDTSAQKKTLVAVPIVMDQMQAQSLLDHTTDYRSIANYLNNPNKRPV